MELQRSKEGAPKFYSVAAAAQKCGVSDDTLRYLERCGIVKPLRFHEPTHVVRLFTDKDIQVILEHYRQRGGVGNQGKNPRRR